MFDTSSSLITDLVIRGLLTPPPPILWRPLMKTPIYLAYPPFFKFCSTSSPALFVALFLCLAWVNMLHLTFYSTKLYNGSTHAELWKLSTRGTLMSVLCNKASSLLRSNTWHVFLPVTWFDITHNTPRGQYTDTPI